LFLSPETSYHIETPEGERNKSKIQEKIQKYMMLGLNLRKQAKSSSPSFSGVNKKYVCRDGQIRPELSIFVSMFVFWLFLHGQIFHFFQYVWFAITAIRVSSWSKSLQDSKSP
jgi:hypothetical protein